MHTAELKRDYSELKWLQDTVAAYEKEEDDKLAWDLRNVRPHVRILTSARWENEDAFGFRAVFGRR